MKLRIIKSYKSIPGYIVQRWSWPRISWWPVSFHFTEKEAREKLELIKKEGIERVIYEC